MLVEIAGFLDAAPDAIVVTDTQGKMTVVNIQTEKMFEWSRSDLISQPVEMLIPERFRERHRIHYQSFVMNPICRPMSGMGLWGLRKNGEEFPVEIGLGPVTNVDGMYLSSIIRDVTEARNVRELRRIEHEALEKQLSESKRLREELEWSVRELSESNNRKEQFLGMLGHELRNPISVISNATQVLNCINVQDVRVREIHKMIAKHVRHLGRLVDDLLDVSRFTRGKINLRKTVFDIKDAIKQGEEATRIYMEEKRHHLMVNLPGDSLKVCADLNRIAQVITNLLHNAAKYTPERGEIVLSLERHQEHVWAIVQDNGVGISPENLNTIFDLFSQVDTTIDRASGGLGIGLTLVRNIMIAHGGGAWAESEGKGKGSRFIVQLPVLHIPTTEIAWHEQKPVSRPRRVLVVDDVVDAANSMSMLLKLSGHEVYTAGDGPTTLRSFAENKPDVVLLDIGIPEMNGYEIARRIRQVDKNVLLVAITGFSNEEDKKRSREAGFNEHLVKPVEPKVLAEYLK